MQRGGRGRGRAGAAGGRGGARAANRKRCRLGVLGCNGIDDDIELRGQTFCLLHAFDGGYFDTQTEEEMIQEAKDRGFKLLGDNGKPMQGQAASARLVKTTEVRCLCAWVCDVVCSLADAACLLACLCYQVLALVFTTAVSVDLAAAWYNGAAVRYGQKGPTAEGAE